MKPEIKLTKIWFDDDLIEFRINSTDGTSFFSNRIYSSNEGLEDLIQDLDRFKNQVHGGIYDIRFGEFGPEYAGGAFSARLHFQNKIFITIHAQSEFKQFGIKKVANESMLYFISEAALLDNFIRELKAIASGNDVEARLEGI